MTARVEAIFIAAEKAQPVRSVESAQISVGKGLTGDRYAAHAGTFSKSRGELDSGRDVTLIAAEAIEAAFHEHRIDLGDGSHRRNLVTRGLGMDNLLMRDDLPRSAFLVIGSDPIVLRVDRTCPPCKHLERLARGSFDVLKHRGGLRTTVLRSGMIRVGDEIVVRERRDVAGLIGELTNV